MAGKAEVQGRSQQVWGAGAGMCRESAQARERAAGGARQGGKAGGMGWRACRLAPSQRPLAWETARHHHAVVHRSISFAMLVAASTSSPSSSAKQGSRGGGVFRQRAGHGSVRGIGQGAWPGAGAGWQVAAVQEPGLQILDILPLSHSSGNVRPHCCAVLMARYAALC